MLPSEKLVVTLFFLLYPCAIAADCLSRELRLVGVVDDVVSLLQVSHHAPIGRNDTLALKGQASEKARKPVKPTERTLPNVRLLKSADVVGGAQKSGHAGKAAQHKGPVKLQGKVGDAYHGYAPATEATIQEVILCGVVLVLVGPIILIVSSCYTAHFKMQLFTHEFLHVLAEKRTMCLLILPILACITTLTMTWLDYKWYRESIGLPLDEGFLVSHSVNFQRVEPYSAWLARWGIWVLVIFGAVEYKLTILPWEVAWLPLTWGIALLLVIVSGIHQFDATGYYHATVWGIPGFGRQAIHIIFAQFAFFVCWFETVMFWWKSKALHIFYACLVLGFLVTFDTYSIHTAAIEWAVLGCHFVVVWYREPIVRKEFEEGSWRPWVGCCGFCCPTIEADPEGTNCCPPVPPSIETEVVGPTVEVKSEASS
jgi:hypothetical protein